MTAAALAEPQVRTFCEAFFRLVADHGTFHIDQILEYVALRKAAPLRKAEQAMVLRQVGELGAKRGFQHNSSLFHFRVRARRGLPKGKRDKQTLDLFATVEGQR